MSIDDPISMETIDIHLFFEYPLRIYMMIDIHFIDEYIDPILISE